MELRELRRQRVERDLRNRPLEERELRIAPVMTGGTSLAVWMGGVTAELYRLLCSTPPPTSEDGDARDDGEDEGERSVYTRLLDLTATRPVVDVITGTSAGGLNGTLLAGALRLGITPTTFMELRTTWMRVADLEALLRSPQTGPTPSTAARCSISSC